MGSSRSPYVNLSYASNLAFECIEKFATLGALLTLIDLKIPIKLSTFRLGALIPLKSNLEELSKVNCSSNGQLETKVSNKSVHEAPDKPPKEIP